MDWLTALIMTLGSGLFGLLGGGGKNAQTTTTETSPPQEDPLFTLLKPYLLQSIGGRQNSMRNWGYPAGMQMPGASGDMWEQLSSLISGEWPQLLQGYKTAGEKDTCESKCAKQYPGVDEENRRVQCVSVCKSKG